MTWPILRSHESLWLGFLPWPTFPCAMAHFDYVCDVMETKLLGLASKLIAAKVISKKMSHCLPNAEDGQFALGVDLQRKIRSLRLPFMSAGPYGGFICTTITQPHLTCKPSIKVMQKSVAYRLRTNVLQLHYIFVMLHSKLLAIIKNYFLINTALLRASLQIQRQNFM